MKLGDVLIIIGIVLIALDWILIHSGGLSYGGTPTRRTPSLGLVHIGAILIGFGVLLGADKIIG